MTLAHARALFPPGGPEPIVEPLAPEEDRRSLHRLAQMLLRFAPIVGLDPDTLEEDGEPDGLLMDVSGCAHLFDGETEMARRITRFVRRLGVECRVGRGACVGEAWALARFGAEGENFKGSENSKGSSGVRERAGGVPPDPEGPVHSIETLEPFELSGVVPGALAPLPIAALRLPIDVRAGLLELGLATVGDVRRLPRASLPSRFGAVLIRRLDQALGRGLEFIEPVRPEPPPGCARSFDGPCAQPEAIAGALLGLLGELCGSLRARGVGVRTLAVDLHRLVQPGESNRRGRDVACEGVQVSRPTRDPKHLWSLLRPRMERVNLGFGIERIVLTASRTGRMRPRQLGVVRGVAGGEEEPDRLAELVDTLSNRLGEGRVLRPVVRGSHVPERSFRTVASMRWREPRRREERDERLSLVARAARLERPAMLLERPEPADSDDGLTRLRWRGREHRVRLAIGPERIGAEWWDRRTLSRGESLFYRVQLESGLWLWVERRDGWRVRGMWG